MSNLAKKERKYNVIGMMSGTSLDGLDIAYCTFHLKKGIWTYEIKKSTTIPYPDELKNRLLKAIYLSAMEISILDIDLGRWQGRAVNDFIKNHKLNVDYISTHGHTVFHQPLKGFTLQIGNSYSILKETKIPVISDFRSKDVSLGGNGAPLVPIGDEMLFTEYDYCLNLGGIANISFKKGSERLAFDISPCNMALNHLANIIELPFDRDGEIARKGKLNSSLFDKLNDWDYYKLNGPKSLGFEEVSHSFFSLFTAEVSIEDKLSTVTHHVAYQIAKTIENKDSNLLITGGGAYNDFLIQLIKEYKSNVKVILPDHDVIDFKEALIFAFLGVLKIREEINCLSSVTGACVDSCGGVIYQ